MKELPDIVKELKEAEKLGLFQSKVQTVYEDMDVEQGSPQDLPDSTVGFIEDDLDEAEAITYTDSKDKFTEDFEFYKKVFELSPEAIVVLDKKGTVLKTNDRIFEWLGYKTEEIIGKNILKLPIMTKESKSKVKKNFLKRIIGINVLPYELDFIQKNGEKRVGRIHDAPLKNEKGKIIGDLVLISNITVQEESDSLLKFREKKYRTIFENVNDVIIYLDAKGKILEVNRRIIDVTGRKPEDIIGRHFSKSGFFSLKDIPKMIKLFKDITSGKTPELLKLNLKHRNGHTIPIEASIRLIKNEGKTDNIVGIIRDVSERKIAAEKIAESDEMYHDIFENSSDMIQAVKPDGSFLYVNRAWKDILDYNEEELENLSLIDIIHPTQKDHCMKVFKDIISGGIIDYVETIFVSKNGQEVIVEGNISCHFKDGKPYSTRGIFRDITERKKADEKMMHVAKEWETTFDSISDLISIMDENYMILNANKSYLDTFNMKREDLVGKRCYEIVHSSEKPFPGCPHMQTLKTKKPESVEFFEPNLGVYLEVSTSPIFDTKGKVVGTIHIAKNISKRKEAEWALGERLKEFKCLYRISDSIHSDKSLDNLLVDMTTFIKDAFQYPDIARSRIKIDDKKYLSVKFNETKLKLTADIIVNDKKRGVVEVYYLEERTGNYKEPFLKEEMRLLDEIANYLGLHIEKVENELLLEEKIDELERYKKITVNRELKMAELKKRNEELERKSS